jgi:hypothetical protein
MCQSSDRRRQRGRCGWPGSPEGAPVEAGSGRRPAFRRRAGVRTSSASGGAGEVVVLPLPAGATHSTGPGVAVAASRWSGARRASLSATEGGSTREGCQTPLRWRLCAFGVAVTSAIVWPSLRRNPTGPQRASWFRRAAPRLQDGPVPGTAPAGRTTRAVGGESMMRLRYR